MIELDMNKQIIKRRHHHVWRSYLKAWAENELIFCLQGNRVFSSNIVNVAVEKDFYKLQSLSLAEFRFLEHQINQSPEALRKIHFNFILMFNLACQVKDRNSDRLAEYPDFSDILEQQIANNEEDYHERWETNAMPFMAALKNQDTSFYNDSKQCGEFLYYLSLQYFRTKTMKERVTELIDADRIANFDINKCWAILRHIYAVNMGRSLLLERQERPLQLLVNQTNVPFITGDQPVINLFAPLSLEQEATQVALYYPVTPWLAIILDEPNNQSGYGVLPLSPEQISQLNQQIYQASRFQVFAHSENVLMQQKEKLK